MSCPLQNTPTGRRNGSFQRRLAHLVRDGKANETMACVTRRRVKPSKQESQHIMKTNSILTAVLLGLGTAGVMAQEGGDRPEGRGPRPGGPGGPGQGRPDPAELLARLDQDGNGKISRDEVPGRMAQRFDQLDKNSDGYLTKDELARRGGPRGQGGGRPDPAEMFNRLDKNTDGKVTRDEAPERMAQHFDELDKNSDGALTPDELKRPGGGGPGGRGGRGAHGGGGPHGPEPHGE